MDDGGKATHRIDAQVMRGASAVEEAHAEGRYEAECVGPDGAIKWRGVIDNTVVTVGKNLALDTYLAGSAYTVVGPYMGLISSASYSTISVSDTMTSHAGWLEAGAANAPTYSAPRKLCVWAAAGAASKSLSVPLSFGITGAGTIKGAFIVYGMGAVATIGDTNGVLYSAGLFTGGDKTVGNGDTLTISYSASI
jgi:hypothetical protein